MGKRAQALGVTISTQAADDLHFFSEMLDAEPDPTIYVQLHTAPDDCALDDRDAWAAANPALGHFLNEDQFADAAARAMRSKSFAPSFRLLQPKSADRSRGPVYRASGLGRERGAFRSRSSWRGRLAMAGSIYRARGTLRAFSLWFPDAGKLLTWHWAPSDTIAERVERDRVPYDRNGRTKAGWSGRRGGQPTAWRSRGGWRTCGKPMT